MEIGVLEFVTFIFVFLFLLFFSLLLDQIGYFVGGFDTVHDWHPNIHEDESIGSVDTSTGLLQFFCEFVQSDFAIGCVFDVDIIILLQQVPHWDNIELHIIHDQYLWLAATYRRLRWKLDLAVLDLIHEVQGLVAHELVARSTALYHADVTDLSVLISTE